jgi:uncharacterized protein
MLWKDMRESGNVEDRRAVRPGVVGGGIGTIILVLVGLYFGVSPQTVMQLTGLVGQGAGGTAAAPGLTTTGNQAEDERAKFVSVVLADTEDVWHEIFTQSGKTYREPKLVLFRGQVSSACGSADSAVGPFYCSGDQRVYLDLGFFDELSRRFGAPGDFAQAYVVAHEIGHHVQYLLGISDQVHAKQQRVGKTEANALSVRLELQADFFAGVWAKHAQQSKHILEPGDLEAALRAASAVGDDRLQKQARGYVVPDSFTHGTSEQRIRWFRKGFETGDWQQGNTFTVAQP